MPNTPAAAPAVSSTVGLKDVVIAPVTADTEAATTYGDLQRAGRCHRGHHYAGKQRSGHSVFR